MKTNDLKNREHYTTLYFHMESDYRTAREKWEAWEALEAERFLEPWEADEKKEAERVMNDCGALLEEEEEQSRRHICESQGLSFWC